MFKFFFKSSKLSCIIIILFLITNCYGHSLMADDNDKPDLIITFFDFPEEVNEGEEVEFILRFQNIGTKNITAGINLEVALKIDFNIVSTNTSSSGLNIGKYMYLNLSWIAEVGDNSDRIVGVEVDYQNLILESDENNNNQDGLITISEQDSNIRIISTEIPDLIIHNETAEIKGEITNYGADTTNTIYIKFKSFEDGQTINILYQEKLARKEKFMFSINWNPLELGSQKIRIDIVYNEEIHDYIETNVIVGAARLTWWDENWHYRYTLTASGTGNASKNINFTELLYDLEVYSKYFENDTIRIIEYYYDGEPAGIVQNYNFDEDNDYNSLSKANGTISWDVSNGEQEKYYCIYFDVANNPGIRNPIAETEEIIIEDANIDYDGYVEGWYTEISKPLDCSYSFVNVTIYISIITSAIAENVSAFIFLNNNPTTNYTIFLDDITNGIEWDGNVTINKSGKWIVQVSSYDSSGYNASIKEHNLYVGKPDLELIDIEYKTNYPLTSPTIYIDNILIINATIYSHNATLLDINITLTISDENGIIHNQTKFSTFTMDENTIIYFEWLVNVTGNYNLKIFIDPDNLIDEQDEQNNEMIKSIIINDWPDLYIKKIVWPNLKLMQYESVDFKIFIGNKGPGDANNYEIKLFIEHDSMTYTNEINSTNVSVKSGNTIKASLIWESAIPGQWLVGVKIFISDSKKDLNTSNNSFLSKKILTVTPIESNKPVIKDFTIEPDETEQGGIITFTANITDDLGLESVFLTITDPDFISHDYNMIQITKTIFNYEFEKTEKVGLYSYELAAIDISLNKNNESIEGFFDVIEDVTPPVISSIEERPHIQLINKSITISCIATDNIGISSVEIVITFPTGVQYEDEIEDFMDGRYVYKKIYNISGGYLYYIRVKDIANKIATSDENIFWITENLDDFDSDGIPNWWEERYGFNPEDASDADNDYDEDGITNINEYKGNTNPQKDILMQNIAYHVRTNILYLLISIMMFLAIIILSIFDKRRR